MGHYKRGDHIFIPFYSYNGESVQNRHHEPRLYKSVKSYISHYGERDGVELVEYAPIVEAEWVDATKPGQITCGGNPVYACGRCGEVYGSFELFPSAKYCRECGAKMKGVRLK